MEGIVKLIGIVMVAAGVVYFVKPVLIKKTADFIMKEKWIYVCGIVSFIIGIIFLRAASLCAIKWLVILLGIIAIIKGILVFVLGQQKIKSLIGKWMSKPVNTWRTLAIIKIAVGVIIIYSA
jgi:uncharacterized protein YjeT (DUF2065 family)